MTIKSQGRKLGRMIRRLTGLPLPIAMSIGKHTARHGSAFDLIHKYPDIITQEQVCECCGYETKLTGPKGYIQAPYITSASIEKEYRIYERLKQVPMGTPVSAE